jgi:8-oxo-dGTP diphosphatase
MSSTPDGGVARVEVAVGAIVTRTVPASSAGASATTVSGDSLDPERRRSHGERDRRSVTEILLVLRGRGAGAGLWSVPGGRVEPGETLEQAVAREVLEETGIVVSVEGFVGWVERIDPAGSWHYVILDFAARPQDDSAVPRAGDDAADARWVATDSLSAMELVPGLLDFLVEHGVTASRAA